MILYATKNLFLMLYLTTYLHDNPACEKASALPHPALEVKTQQESACQCHCIRIAFITALDIPVLN